MEATKYTGSTSWPDLVVNKINLLEPLTWLSKGWKDMLTAGFFSFRISLVIVLISGLLTYGCIATDNLFLLAFLLSGFFMVAPVVGIGYYQISAHIENNESLNGCSALTALKQNQGPISLVTAGFMMILNLWISLNFTLFAFLYSGISPPLDNLLAKLFLSEEGRNFAIASVTTGFIFASFAFMISVVTVPMLINRKVDGFTAIRMSVKSVLSNFIPMMLWAFLIVVIIGLGLLTFYVGLLVALPLIGHSTWHAYRTLIPSAE